MKKLSHIFKNFSTEKNKQKSRAIICIKQKLILLLFLNIAFSFDSILIAQQNSNILPEVWSLQECFDYTNKNNIQLQTLSKDIDPGQQDLLQARAGPPPNFSARPY